MAYIYTPGLKVLDETEIRKQRRLPIRGEVTVAVGDAVSWDTVVARTFLPGRVEILKATAILGIDGAALAKAMVKAQGDGVRKGDLIARSSAFWGLLKSSLEAPVDGVIETVSARTGQVIIRESPVALEVAAFVDGTVEEVHDGTGVTVVTRGAYVQGILGVGGEAVGPLAVIAENPAAELSPSLITERLAGTIVAGGARAGIDVLRACVKAKVRGVVTGGIDDSDLKEFMGSDLGVAVTGTEELGLVLIVTEGFGVIPMAEKTLSLLKRHDGRRTSICGATQIRAGVLRPELIIPSPAAGKPPAVETPGESPAAEAAVKTSGLEVGSAVRIIREPRFGRLAKVTALPVEPQLIPTGATVRVLEVTFPDGETMALPRANVEVLEG